MTAFLSKLELGTAIGFKKNMKYKIILLLFLLLSFSGRAQKKYVFDYILEYRLQVNETSKVEIVYLLTNSSDNSYSMYVYQDRDVATDFILIFSNDFGVGSYTSIEKSEFFKAETIELSCENLRFSSQKNDKYDSKRYLFKNELDTLINGVQHRHYTMRFTKLRDSKRYKKGVAHYIVENNTEFHNPLGLLSVSFDVKKTSKILPNGIAKEIFTTSYDGKSKIYFYKLIQFVKMNKYVIIPDNCDVNAPIPYKLIFK